MKHIAILSILFFNIMLSACSGNRAINEAKTSPPLRIPQGLSTAQFHHAYPIPERHYPDDAKNVSIVPPI